MMANLYRERELGAGCGVASRALWGGDDDETGGGEGGGVVMCPVDSSSRPL